MENFGPITVVEWRDSCGLAGGPWHDPEHAKEMTASVCRSIGWIIRECKREVVMVSHATEHRVGGEMLIIKSTIVRRWTLKDPTKHKAR